MRKAKSPVIGQEGLRRNIGNEATLYRWGLAPRNVTGPIGMEGERFFIESGRRYRIMPGFSIAMYPGTDRIRFYDVVMV